MRLLEAHAPNLAAVLRRDAVWMTWNLLLAWIPVVLAFGLFRRGQQRTPLWWGGIGLLVLFLPNAPYVVTDLIHLGDDVRLTPGDWSVVTAVLPVYAAFIGAGFLAYYLVLSELGRYLDRAGFAAWHGVTVVGTHAVCAVGVYLGRHARLNSWEPVVEPHSTFDRIILAVSWRAAPVFVLGTFVVICIGHFVTKAVIETAMRTVTRVMASAVHPRQA